MKVWMYCPKPQTLPEKLKHGIEMRARRLIDSDLKEKHIIKKKPKNDNNYIVDIYYKWIGKRFYLCAKYLCPHPRALFPSFESRFARLEYHGDNKFQLSFMRYTGSWVTLYQDISLEKSFKAIKEEPYFTP